MLEIVPATPELAQRYAGANPPRTFRGHAALRDGEVVGLGGIYYQDGQPVIFSEYKEMSRKDRARCFRFLERVASEWKGRLYAVCDAAHPGSPGLLRRLGFSPLHESWWVRL